MNDKTKKLLMEIAHCENVKNYYDNHNAPMPCRRVIKSQKKKGLNEFQLPEPWNGDIEKAPILFLSSNPGIKSSEVFPTWSKSSWPEDLIVDFFTNRFGGGKKEWKDANGKSLYRDKNNNLVHKNGAKFWQHIKNTVAEIIKDENITTLREAAKHFSSTEIVHCKSKSEKGVRKARTECIGKYLCRILNISKAKVVVCLGAKVRKVIQPELVRLDKYKNLYRDKKEGKPKRIYIFLPHPNARVKKKKIDKVLKESELKELINFV